MHCDNIGLKVPQLVCPAQLKHDSAIFATYAHLSAQLLSHKTNSWKHVVKNSKKELYTIFNICQSWMGLKKRESFKNRDRHISSYLVKSTTVFDFPLWSGWQSTFLGLFIGPAWIFSGSHHICSQPDAASTPWSWILANTNTNTQQFHQNLWTCSFTVGTALYARYQSARHRRGQRITHMCQKHQN